jgi:hypothetical protein
MQLSVVLLSPCQAALGISNIAALIAWIGWGVAVVALACLQHSCSATSTLGYAVTGNYDLIQPSGKCHRVYQFFWWLLALELFCLFVTTFGMWTPHVRKHRPGIVSLIAVSTALAMIAANSMLALVYTVGNPVHRRAIVAFIGFCIYSLGNGLLILALGRYENDHPNVTRAVHDSSAYDTAPVGTVTGLDSGYENRPTVPTGRGYVGNTPAGGVPVLHTDRV